MLPRLLLDTHVLVRWLFEAKRLSRQQSRAIEEAMQRSEPVALSAITLLEIAVLVSGGHLRLTGSVEEFFSALAADPAMRVLPLSYEVAAEAAALGSLKDPADRAIVATARVHRLRLVTSDQRIIDSSLVPVVD